MDDLGLFKIQYVEQIGDTIKSIEVGNYFTSVVDKDGLL